MNVRLKSSILAGFSSLLLLFPSVKDSKLTDITKPYLGVYECKQAKLGSLDCLERFSYIQLELKDEENFTLYYREKNGERKQTQGKYRHDPKRETLTLLDDSGEEQREFPLKNGRLTATVPIGGKNLIVVFEQK